MRILPGPHRAAAASLAMVGAAALAGCVRVPPRPVDLPARAAARLGAGLDAAAVVAEVRRIAPAAPVVAGRLDRLALFAALLLYDPKITEARAAVASAAREAASARKVGSPTLTLTSEYANDPAASSPWLLGGAVDLPLDIGARRSARLERADLAVLLARYDLAETVWSERMALRRALTDYFAAHARIPLLEGLLALQDRQLAALDRRAKLGETAVLDVYPYRLQRAQAARALDEARRQRALSQAQIAGTLGLPGAALDPLPLAWEDFEAPRAAQAPIPSAERAQAIAGRSDVLRSLVAYDQSEADVRLEVGKQYPAVSIGPGYTWERGLVKLPLSVNLAFPSFDLNRSAIRTAVAKRDQAGAAIESALAGAAAAIEAALAECIAARASLARIRAEELPQTQAAAARADDRLRQGEIARADWAAAQIAALQARLGAIDALVRVQQGDAALEDTLRRPLEGPESLIDPHLLEPAE